MITANGDLISETLEASALNFDSIKSKCCSKTEPGRVVFSFNIDEKTELRLITISMRIASSPSEGIWEIAQANLTVTRAGSELRKKTFPLGVKGIYASSTHSYSCNELVLETLHRKRPDNDTDRVEPKAVITLERFQLQPFSEPGNTVFAPSFDCSVWFNVAGLMGLIVVLFMIFVTVIGVSFLKDIQTNDFKYNKEGLLFTQSQMESNKSR